MIDCRSGSGLSSDTDNNVGDVGVGESNQMTNNDAAIALAMGEDSDVEEDIIVCVEGIGTVSFKKQHFIIFLTPSIGVNQTTFW